ncbi:hypothetical protein [Sphingomonas sp. GC_Shp_3]|uniref:hypothetical protein n=1 Tax=Sphingomonas sp. GC_Shp_3 TaxID=2937383 RepID=UPI00226A7782|nr:hypothetical protein [Sphingomonas sp. GC_Shp_3]
MKALAPVLCLLLLTCSSRGSSGDADAIYNAGEQEAQLSPGVQPVRIGEGGAAFAACAGSGVVVNLSPTNESYLSLRAAPFTEASEVARLTNGTALLLCSHSLDQRWQGVVVPPAGGGAADCGVDAPIATARGYTGPCKSGWVSSAFVQARAG